MYRLSTSATMRRTILLSFAASLAALACSAPPSPSDERVTTSSSKIIKGKASDASQNAAVLLLYPVGGGAAYACTGTLLAPNLVLTARHCVSTTDEQPVVCDENGVGTSGGSVTGDYTASNIYIVTGTKRPPTLAGAYAARGKTIIHDGATNLCNHDLALLLLDQPISNAQIAPIRLDGPVVKNETFTAIGWGVTTSTPAPSVRQQRSGVAVQLVGPGSDLSGGGFVPDHEFVGGEAVCQGDSGGPALSDQTGAIIGVASRGGDGPSSLADPSSSCIGVANVYSTLSGFKDMVLAAYSQAGQDPWLENGPDPRLAKFGESCTGNEACRSALCLADGAGNFTTCAQACGDQGPCPDGYDCKTADGASVCQLKPAPPKNAATATSGCAMSDARSAATSSAWLVGAAAVVFGARRRRRQ